jgi:bacillithiol biosynthesis deacetylase BshB1
MSTGTLDLLAVGAHPDDAEAACGGLLAKLAARGARVGICDLTRGELGTNGTVEIRAAEAAAAARTLNVGVRVQLGLPDGGIDGRSQAQAAALVEVLRTHAPRLLVGPHPHSRHPDHVEAAALVARARFFVAVPRFAPGSAAARRPVLLQAPDYWPLQPSFVVDIGEFLAVKLAALRCYRSQFERGAGREATHLNDPAYLARIETDARHYGRLAGVAAGEAFVVDGVIPVDDPLRLWPEGGKAST